MLEVIKTSLEKNSIDNKIHQYFSKHVDRDSHNSSNNSNSNNNSNSHNNQIMLLRVFKTMTGRQSIDMASLWCVTLVCLKD